MRIIARLNMGGPAIHVVLLNAGLDKERFSSYLVTGTIQKGEQDAGYLAKKAGVEPLIIPELKRDIGLGNDLVAFIKLFRLMRNIKPDIVHTHTAKAGALGRAAAVIAGVPVRIHTFHGHVFHSYFGAFRSAVFVFIERVLARWTNRIIVISEAQLAEVRDGYKIASGKRFAVIPLGLDLAPFLKIEKNASFAGEGSLRKRFSIDKETLLAGVVGRLVGVKNHRMFIDAAKIIKKKAPDINAKFLIIGGGALKDELEAHARALDMARSVIFTGWCADAASLYKEIDIACLTSLNEGTPISLIEAMAAARPVVSTDVGGVRDVVRPGETGMLSPSGDAEKFSENLISLLRDAEMRERMGEAGRRSVIARFSKERLINDIEELYEEELKKLR